MMFVLFLSLSNITFAESVKNNEHKNHRVSHLVSNANADEHPRRNAEPTPVINTDCFSYSLINENKHVFKLKDSRLQPIV